MSNQFSMIPANNARQIHHFPPPTKYNCLRSIQITKLILIEFILFTIIMSVRFFRLFRGFSVLHSQRKKFNGWNKAVKYGLVPVTLAYAYYQHSRKHKMVQNQQDSQIETPFLVRQNRVVSLARYLWRILELSFIFAPSIILLPLYFFKRTRDFWLEVFLKAIKKAGIVWIKAFQYLSHRRDIIGVEMAAKFEVLRENAPYHSLEETREIISRVYGREIEEVFEQFDYKPIASGSVSQVYRARLNGKQVAVKIRHPYAGLNLERDIQLLFAFSNFFSLFSRAFQIPVTHDSLKRILTQQLDFLREKKNIDKFNRIIVDRDLKFPATYNQSTSEVLIEEFIEGRTIAFYEAHQNDLNRLIANIGAKAFFIMLMKYNFVHADCHAGNIFVRIEQSPNILKNQLLSYETRLFNFVLTQILKYGFNSNFLKKLSQQNYEYEKDIHELIKKYEKRVEIILIDAGMAIKLTNQKKESFQMFLQEVIEGNPLECAKWIYRISQFKGKALVEGQDEKYLRDLEIMFRRVHQTTLQSLQGIQVLNEMLSVIRDHHMKIDGQISILLTNMLVLEAIAKNLDPHINILRCAVPYLQFK